MSRIPRDPGYRYVFHLAAGGVITAHPRDAIRVIDKRHEQAPPVTVWEVKDGGIVRRLWPEDIANVSQEAVK